MSIRLLGPPSVLLGIFIVSLTASSAIAQTKPATPQMPSDLNLASLRVSALTALYELDLSPEQLKTLRTAAPKMVATKKRAVAKANPALMQAFKDFQAAIVAGKDDATIARARNHVAEAAADLDLDDSIDPTDAALAGAPAVCSEIKASQLAAFLAVHADEVADPEEMILGALESIRDIRADATAGKAAATEAEINTLATETGADASYLVFGTDTAKSKPMAAKISTWLKTNGELAEKAFDAQTANRDDAIKKMIGKVDPIEVLAHWLNLRLAELLSNPELPAAIDTVLSALAAATK